MQSMSRQLKPLNRVSNFLRSPQTRFFRNKVRYEHVKQTLISHKKKGLVTLVGLGLLAADYKIYMNTSVTLTSLKASDFPESKEEMPTMVSEAKAESESPINFYNSQMVWQGSILFGIAHLLTFIPSTTLVKLFFFGLVLLNERKLILDPIHAIYNYFNSIQVKPFVQGKFNDAVRNNYPNLNWDERGNCFGLTMMWFILQCAQRVLIDELNQISFAMKHNQSLTEAQLNLLNNIHEIQNLQLSTATRIFYSIFVSDSRDLKNGLSKKIKFEPDWSFQLSKIENKKSILKDAIKMAESNPNSLVAISVEKRSPREGHILGLKANYVDGKINYKYFEPNCEEASFDRADALEKRLSRIISCYQNQKFDNIRLLTVTGHQKQNSLFWKKAPFIVKYPQSNIKDRQKLITHFTC